MPRQKIRQHRSRASIEHAIDARLALLLATCWTWGQMEQLAGVVDREAFWLLHKTEDEGRAALVVMIRQRVADGKI